MINVVVMGECMVEFGSADCTGLYQQGFAGDVFNTGVYIKRCLQKKASVKFLTVVGTDPLSGQLLSMMHQEQLESDLVHRSKQKKLGLYLINVDEEGERSFTYWRENSAARQLMQFIHNDLESEKHNNIDILFLSGISIAILPAQDLAILWQYINELKAKGTVIIFDPNYRPALWQSADLARQAFNTAFSLADIALPGVDDHAALYNARHAEDVADHLESFNLREIIIKNGPDNVLTSIAGERRYIDIKPVKNVVDTTSAGDAFNGGYISARILGHEVNDAVNFAANVASCVIQHKGAIIGHKQFEQFMAENDGFNAVTPAQTDC